MNYVKVKQQRDEAMRQCTEIRSKLTPVIENTMGILSSPYPVLSQNVLQMVSMKFIMNIKCSNTV